MAVRQRRRTTDTTESIRAVIGKIFSCGDFAPTEFPLPSEKGAQLSMTGEIIACGNGGNFNISELSEFLLSVPTVRPSGQSDIQKYADKKRHSQISLRYRNKAHRYRSRSHLHEGHRRG